MWASGGAKILRFVIVVHGGLCGGGGGGGRI